MKKISNFLILFSAPVFLLGFLYSLYYSHHSLEMPLMWLTMFFAHISPWLLLYQHRKLHKLNDTQ